MAQGQPIDICGDGSILKTIITPAPEDAPLETPKRGDKVKVHYVGTLTETGAEFDSSRSRGTPFEFTVGSGVITGWSEAVPTMRIGEVAKFTIASHKAYGAQGSPPQIPADASLDFEIELLSFTDREDVNPNGVAVLKKALVSDSSKWRKPNHSCDLIFGARRPGETEWEDGEWESGKSGAAIELPKFGALPQLCRVALESMSEEEVASFIIESVEYEFKLYRWIENEECVPSKPGAVVKRVEREFKEDEDAGWKTPSDTNQVRIRGVVKTRATGLVVADYGNISESHEAAAEDQSGTCFEVDEHEGFGTRGDQKVAICEGVEAGIRRMKRSEVAVIKIDPQYGFKDSSLVPVEAVNVDLEARLELCSFEDDKPSWELKDDEKIAAVDDKRNMGNRHFGKGDYARASRRYSQAINMGASDYDLDDERKKRLKTATSAARLNRAACHLKARDYVEAKNDVNAVLEHDPDNTKALFRRAKAYIGLDEWPRAKKDLQRVLELTPESLDAKRALVDVAKRERAYKEHQKKLYAGKRLFKDEVPKATKSELPETSSAEEPESENQAPPAATAAE